MRIAIGADHAGFELKECVKARLLEWKQDVLDLGTNSAKPVDYPDYAEAVESAETIYLLLEHLAANRRAVASKAADPGQITFVRP